MNPSKAWAMLTARGIGMGGAHGGTPTLTPAEVARLLQGLDRGPFLAGMVKESMDLSSLNDLERWLWIDTMDYAGGDWEEDEQGKFIRWIRKPWPFSHGQAYCRRLAGLAVYEFLLPRPNQCSNCGGKGSIRSEGNWVECVYCRNTGGQPLSARTRSELSGIPFVSWSDGWDERYERVHDTVQWWHSTALSHLRKALEAHLKSG